MLTLFHDYTAPASAVAVARAQRLADEGLAVEMVGFEAIGVDVALPVTVDVISALEELRAEAATEGLELRRPPALPPTGAAHVVEQEAESVGLGASWRQTCYRAYWEEGADLADVAVLTTLAGDAGLDPSRAAAAAGDRARLTAFRRRCAGFRGEGVGGVPTILTQRTLVPGLLPEADLRALALL